MRRLQTMVRMAVSALVLVLFVRTFLAEGLLTRFVVSGASMSPALHGAHFVLRCPECATAFCVETEEEARPLPNELPLRWGTCPACSFAQVPVPADAWRPGDRIWVNRAAVSLRAIRRWDAVLFRSPEDGRLTVKRIVGLPGETLEIRDGDIFINGQIAVKSLAVQRAMRIPVLYGRWEMQPGRVDETYELAYHPIRNVPHNSQLTTRNSQLSGVTNQLCENQWRIEPPNSIYPVRDLMLEFDWQPDDNMPLCVRAMTCNLQLPMPLAAKQNGTHKVEISLFDRRLLVTVDGVIMVEKPLDHESQQSTDGYPFAFSLSENSGRPQSEHEAAIKRQVTNLRVWRDVYYMSGFGLQTSGFRKSPAERVPKPEVRSPKPESIPVGCYYVLGDNSSFSSDSRHWHKPFVAHRDLIGIVTAL